ncbi:MAG TPA: VOC family protein, partial [Cyanobacteria bacterium UBA11049]|nr:VOC family protein [Cyanobacteria bacterium UBA11049]
MMSSTTPSTVLIPGNLRRVHHIALNVKDMQASRHFYGTILG